jgi:hypothetical protein
MSAVDSGSPTGKADQYRGRITVDLDAKEYSHNNFRTRAVRTWHNLQHDADDVEVHVSSSGRGLHFVAWFEQAIPFHVEIGLRRMHGDDQRRVGMDCERWYNGLYTGVLFDEKSSRPMTKERGFVDVYAALDFIAAQRDDHDRMNRLANRGHKGAPSLATRSDL